MKMLKIGVALLVFVMLVWNAIDIQPLDQVRKNAQTGFNANDFANRFFTEKLTPALEQAVDITRLLELLETNADLAFDQHANALAIGNIGYFLIKGEGAVTQIDDDLVHIAIGDSTQTILLETEYVYGNAVRDASGLIKLTDFSTTAELNAAAEAINAKIRAQVIPPFLRQLKKGDLITFYGALELNKKNYNTQSMAIIPIQLKIKS